jgi:putative PIN family toxin of toxin-antitoxin system
LRVILDTNILVSYVLNPDPTHAISAVVEAAVNGDFVLLFPDELKDEFRAAIAKKPYLARRIRAGEADRLIAGLTLVSEAIGPLQAPVPSATRDPKDDYLILYSQIGRVDYLVSGDRDLLALGQVEQVKIVTAAAFLAILHHTP